MVQGNGVLRIKMVLTGQVTAENETVLALILSVSMVTKSVI